MLVLKEPNAPMSPAADAGETSLCPVLDTKAEFEVLPNRESGKYLIVLNIKSIGHLSEVELPFKMYFAKSQLMGAIDKAVKLESEGMYDKYEPSRALVREVYRDREVPVYKEKETIRELIKIRCSHCGTLFEERLDRCPHCSAPN